MKTTVQELKELYAKLGGTADLSNVQTDSGMIDAIDSVAGGGGSLLPATADTLGGVKIGSGISVTSDGTISASGGAEPLICEYSDGYLNKTVGEVYNAFVNGQSIIYHTNVGEGEDSRSGDWNMLHYISITGNSDNGFYALIEFNGGSFYTDTESTVDAVFALYPIMSD